MLAIVSDIHANWDALKVVLADIERRGAREIVCLGDVIGYGPSPASCLNAARTRFSFTLCGNHEWAVVNEPLGFHRAAREAAAWHRKELTPQWYSPKTKKDDWDFLHALPMTQKRGKLLFVHGSPSNPTEEYLLRTDLDEVLHELNPKLRRAFEKTEWVTFCGHTHYPGIITEDGYFYVPRDIGYRFQLVEGKKFIVNVGSVGQPRDGDNRACYVTLDRGVIEYHRVAYDVRATYQKVLDTGSLDRSLAERLLSGT